MLVSTFDYNLKSKNSGGRLTEVTLEAVMKSQNLFSKMILCTFISFEHVKQ